MEGLLIPTVLHVDDDENMRVLVAKVLELYKFSVVSASSIEEAYRLLDSRDWYCVICDGTIDDRYDGFRLAQELQNRNYRVVMFTGEAGARAPNGIPLVEKGQRNFMELLINSIC